MSSIPFRGPEFRLHLGYPDIILTAGGRTLGRVATEAPDLRAGLARMAEAIRRARGRVVVVLPDSEVWRGRLDLAGADRAARRASARIAIAGRLSAAPDEVAVVMGARDAGGSFPVAGVRRSTLIEARALLSAVGLRPSAIVGAGLFPGFVAAPRLGGGWTWPLPTLPPERRGLAVTAGAGAMVALALLVLGGPDASAPEAVAVTAPLPTVVIAEAPALGAPVAAAPVRAAEVAAPKAPAPSLALTRSAPPKPRPTPAPVVTLAARNMPSDLPVVIATPKPSPVERLVEIGAAPARALGAITAPLRRPAAAKPAPDLEPDLKQAARAAMPALPAPAASSDLRPLRRPKAATPAESEAKATVRPSVSQAATLAPRPREAGGGAQPAILVASLEPAPFAEAALAAAAAATVATALDTPPPARPAVRKAAPAPAVVKAAAPKVVRPQPVSVQPLVQQAVPQRQVVASATPARQPVAAPAPVRQKLVAQPAPVRQAAKPATVKPVRVKTVPVKTVPVKTVAVTPFTVKPVAAKPVAAKPVAAKPAPVRVAQKPVKQKPVKQKPAKQQVGLSRGSVSLVGVFGGADGRHALVRLPNGDIEKVRAGDRVQGMQIAAVNADSVQVTGRGRDTLLRLPD